MVSMDATTWEERFCLTQSCRVGPLVARRVPNHDNVWTVARSEGSRSWTVSAPTPVCPLCGGYLATANNVAEGVGRPADPALDLSVFAEALGSLV